MHWQRSAVVPVSVRGTENLFSRGASWMAALGSAWQRGTCWESSAPVVCFFCARGLVCFFFFSSFLFAGKLIAGLHWYSSQHRPEQTFLCHPPCAAGLPGTALGAAAAPLAASVPGFFSFNSPGFKKGVTANLSTQGAFPGKCWDVCAFYRQLPWEVISCPANVHKDQESGNLLNLLLLLQHYVPERQEVIIPNRMIIVFFFLESTNHTAEACKLTVLYLHPSHKVHSVCVSCGYCFVWSCWYIHPYKPRIRHH